LASRIADNVMLSMLNQSKSSGGPFCSIGQVRDFTYLLKKQIPVNLKIRKKANPAKSGAASTSHGSIAYRLTASAISVLFLDLPDWY